MAEIVKVSLSSNMKELIKNRASELEMSCPEYLRLLADLDISIQRYQNLVTYINMLYNKIQDCHDKLGIAATPLQEPPLIKLN